MCAALNVRSICANGAISGVLRGGIVVPRKREVKVTLDLGVDLKVSGGDVLQLNVIRAEMGSTGTFEERQNYGEWVLLMVVFTIYLQDI